MAAGMTGTETQELDSNRSSEGILNKFPRKRSPMFWAAALVLFGCMLACGYWWFFMRNRVATDNAYVSVTWTRVSSRVPGTVSQVNIQSEDYVTEGDVLFKLETQDYNVLLDKAKAALERNEAEIQMTEYNISAIEAQTNARVLGAQALVEASQQKEKESRHHLDELKRSSVVTQAELDNSTKELTRYQNLFRTGAGSEQRLDNANTSFKKTKAQSEAMQSQIAAAEDMLALFLHLQEWSKANLDVAKADLFKLDIEKKKLESLKAKGKEMQAELDAAELNLSYCTIKAPMSGYIAQKEIDVGERVQPGQLLMAIVPLHDVWVEANFKETQLKDVRVGQPVEIKADIYPGRTFKGKVYGIDAGTGAAFSLLPPQNATGNWIKVVQRIPVKVLLDSPPPAEYPLPIGCSLDVTVFTSDQNGPKLRAAKNIEKSNVSLSQQSAK